MLVNNSETNSEVKGFETKRKLLFDCLDNAEKDLKGTNLDQSQNKSSVIKLSDIFDKSLSRDSNKTSKFQGKQSIFKKPELPITKCLRPRKTPDYQMNPHKWKKYSLSDVDISDQTNTAAAFSFLKDIEIQKEREAFLNEQKTDTSSKPVFNKSVGIKRCLKQNSEIDDIDKPKLKGSKFVMPEYSFGETKQRKEKHRKVSSSKNADSPKPSAKQLRLSHLEEEKSDGDDDNDDDKMS